VSRPVFYAPPEAVVESIITLPEAEARHAVKVMRLHEADMVLVVDGLGTAYRGEISHIAPRKPAVTIRVHHVLRNFGEPSVRLTLAAGLSSGEKFDTVIQKGTELGVKRFVPIVTGKAKVRLDDPKRAAARVRRLEKVALAAIKQARRAYRPDIALPAALAAFLAETDADAANLLFHPSTTARPFEADLIPADITRVSLLVGPESGFSEDEVRLAVEAGFTAVSLGPRILRAETAGPVVCALVMNALGELR